jgi:hypothetical protein
MSSVRRLAVMPQMPRTRGDCVDGPRPCPWIRCRHHLATKLLAGSRRIRLRHIPRGQDTCALDVADRGSHKLVEVGRLLGITRERARQIEVAALRALRSELGRRAGDDVAAAEAYLPEDPLGGGRTAFVPGEHADAA